MNLHDMLPNQLKQAVEEEWPLLVPAGCIEFHGPHLPLGTDTILVEELLRRVAEEIECVTAPPFWYGPTDYAVSGPEKGTVDVSTERFGRYAKDVVASFWDVGFRWIVIGIHHQGLEGPEALSIRQAAAEIVFDKSLAQRGNGWWGKGALAPQDRIFERIQVWPTVPPDAEDEVVAADHAGFYETSLLMAARPDLVDLDQLDMGAPWYCQVSGRKARHATIEAGEQMWQLIVEVWLARLKDLRKGSHPSPEDVTVNGLF